MTPSGGGRQDQGSEAGQSREGWNQAPLLLPGWSGAMSMCVLCESVGAVAATVGVEACIYRVPAERSAGLCVSGRVCVTELCMHTEASVSLDLSPPAGTLTGRDGCVWIVPRPTV